MLGLLMIENIGDHVSKITLNRPKALNALNSELLRELDSTLNHLKALHSKPEKKIRALIITGAGEKSFVAGADIKEFHEMQPNVLEDYINLGLRVMEKIDNFPVPVIAEVGGYCLGGGLELALSCDFIFASEQAKFGLPEITLGLLPGFGGTRRILRRLPMSKAKEVVMTGDMIDAEEALKIGVCDRLYSNDILSSEVLKFSERISKKAPLAIQSIKRSLQKSSFEEYHRDIVAETREFHSLFYTEDAKEGRNAFIENRKPNFIGE